VWACGNEIPSNEGISVNVTPLFGSPRNRKLVDAYSTLISATDSIADVPIFKSLGVAKRLEVLLDGES
jgi:NhaP-type Na+/H+ or K+/H+ antiporter